MKTNRRDFLKATGAAGLAVGAIGGLGACSTAGKPAMGPNGIPLGKPRRVIFLVSDGMSMGAMSLADVFSRQVRGRGTHFYELLRDRKTSRGFFITKSLNSIVTDSAAASSAWGSGSRIFNGAVNTLPDGRKLDPILHVVKNQGFGTGLVSTASITHATPAGFASSVENRGQEEDIAKQYLNKVDVILGGGRNFFTREERSDGHDLVGDYTDAGYTYLSRRDQIPGGKNASQKILGLFNGPNIPFTLDHDQNETKLREIPKIAEMTRLALDSLEQNPNGFCLQVEGALVDWAAHSNDAPGLLWDQLAFDDAVGVCLDFVRRNPETLIVVTSDHGNANPGLNGMGSQYLEADESFARVSLAKATYGEIRSRIGDSDETPAAVKEIIRESLGITLEDEFAEKLAAVHAGEDVGEVHVQQRSFTGILGQIHGNHNGVGWTSSSHTEDPTVIAAHGPGQDNWEGIIDNTDAFGNILSHFGIKHENPRMTPKEARELAHLAPKYNDVHWA